MKTKTKTIAELEEHSLSYAKSKGFDLSATQPGTKMMLILSEVVEAQVLIRSKSPSIFYEASTPNKPEGVGPEVADIVLRVIQTAAFFQTGLSDYLCSASPGETARSHTLRSLQESARSQSQQKSAEDFCFEILSAINEAFEITRKSNTIEPVTKAELARAFAMALISAAGIANKIGFDLDEMVRIKDEYNQSRPQKHGGKTC